MGNGISTATRSRVAVCIAALSILIGFSSPAFAKGKGLHYLEISHLTLERWKQKCKYATVAEKRTWSTLRKGFCRYWGDRNVDNPLGARAMYLGSSLYRIHGSNEPDTIGQAVSSGCIRLTNEDVIDLYSRVRIGTPVIVQ
jgi:L,D-transpeptidase-like protein